MFTNLFALSHCMLGGLVIVIVAVLEIRQVTSGDGSYHCFVRSVLLSLSLFFGEWVLFLLFHACFWLWICHSVPFPCRPRLLDVIRMG